MKLLQRSSIALIAVALAGSACASDKQNKKDFQERETVTYEHEERLGEDYSRLAESDVETDVDKDSVEVEVEREETVNRPGKTDYTSSTRLEVEADGDRLDTEQSFEVNKEEQYPNEKFAIVKVRTKALRMVHFPTNKATLDKRDKRVLRDRAKWLMRNPTAQIVIEGHTDERGTTKHNFGLALERAEAVEKYLGKLGVDTDRLQIVSEGETEPMVDSDTRGAYLLNRRVEFERASKN